MWKLLSQLDWLQIPEAAAPSELCDPSQVSLQVFALSVTWDNASTYSAGCYKYLMVNEKAPSCREQESFAWGRTSRFI